MELNPIKAFQSTFTKSYSNNMFELQSNCAEIVLRFGCICYYMFKIDINRDFSREFESLRPHQISIF